jgi:4-hydroxy-3-methylbut-2-en-1-yl diphosphate reductase
VSKKIVIASPHGFCGGVKRAIEIAQAANPANTYLLGDIVHNDHVIKSLKIKTVKNLSEIPLGNSVIIRAHGATPQVYQEAKKRQLNIIDATCPLVLQVHEFVKLNKDKNIIYLVSDKNHDEAVGVVAQGSNITAYTLDEYDKILAPSNSVLITQTTLSVQETQKTIDYLKNKFPKLEIYPHICPATTDRQKAVLELAKNCEIILIIGSPNSSNSLRLYETAISTGKKAYIVDNITEIQKEWFNNYQNIGISSGASTPENILKEVYDYLATLD